MYQMHITNYLVIWLIGYWLEYWCLRQVLGVLPILPVSKINHKNISTNKKENWNCKFSLKRKRMKKKSSTLLTEEQTNLQPRTMWLIRMVKSPRDSGNFDCSLRTKRVIVIKSVLLASAWWSIFETSNKVWEVIEWNDFGDEYEEG